MTISSTASKTVHLTSASVNSYPFTFKVFNELQLTVTLIDPETRSETKLSPGVDYQVLGLGQNRGGSVALTARGRARAGFDKHLTILRNMEFTQEIDYRPHDVFPAETHERGLDVLTMMCQELREKMDRAILMPTDETDPISIEELTRRLEEAGSAILAGDKFLVPGTTTPRDLMERFGDAVNVRDFGAVGVYPADDTEAIIRADAHAADIGKPLYFPAGQYGFSVSLVQTATWMGDGAPKLAPFPQLDDDKVFLRPGYKHKLPGSSLILLPGAALNTVSTVRGDLFSSLTYAVKTQSSPPVSVRGLALVMDMNVLDEWGEMTGPEDDQRVECEVGYLVDDTPRCLFDDFTVWGYWDKAGLCIWSHGVSDNPDYNKFFNGSTMGYCGLAFIGHDTKAGRGPGLSGTQSFGFQIFGNDHHSRRPQLKKSYQTNGYGHCLFIDGNTDGLTTDLNGHELFGGGLRTYSNRPIVLDNCSHLHFKGVPFEFSTLGDQPDTLNTRFLGTNQTRHVVFDACRQLDHSFFNHPEFGGVVSNMTFISLHAYGDLMVGSKGNYLALRTATLGGAARPRLALTNSPGISSGDSYIDRDPTSGALTLGPFALRDGGRLTVDANGSISPTGAYHEVLGYNAQASQLHTIKGSFAIGQRLLLKQGNQSQPITLMTSGGNIRFTDAAHRPLNYSHAMVELIWNGSYWTEPGNPLALNRQLRPLTDNAFPWGAPSYRFTQLYAASATVNTSDEREKAEIRPVPEAVLRAWSQVRQREYFFREARDRKGSSARRHIGYVAQEVQRAFIEAGLSAADYGLFCHDQWPDEYEAVTVVDREAVLDEGGQVLEPEISHEEQRLVRPAGDRYGLRYGELLSLEAAWQRWKLEDFEGRLAALEANFNLKGES